MAKFETKTVRLKPKTKTLLNEFSLRLLEAFLPCPKRLTVGSSGSYIESLQKGGGRTKPLLSSISLFSKGPSQFGDLRPTMAGGIERRERERKARRHSDAISVT